MDKKLLNTYIQKAVNGIATGRQAIISIPILITIAEQKETITYSELEDIFLRSKLGKKQWSVSKFYGNLLGTMQTILNLADSKSELLNSLVINKGTLLPGDDFFNYVGIKVNDNKEKKYYLNGYHKAVYDKYFDFYTAYDKIKNILKSTNGKQLLADLISIEKFVSFDLNIRPQFAEEAQLFSGLTVEEQKKLRKHFLYEGRISHKDTQTIKNYFFNLNRPKSHKCSVCGLVFKEVYGEIGEDFIELHHLDPYSKLKKHNKRKLTEKDFCVLCSNCHRMMHRLKNSSYDLKDIAILKGCMK